MQVGDLMRFNKHLEGMGSMFAGLFFVIREIDDEIGRVEILIIETGEEWVFDHTELYYYSSPVKADKKCP